MVYLINNTEPQSVFIPKNEPVPVDYKSQYERGYDDGYAAGQSECPSLDLQDKDVVLSAATGTVYPDEGYDGMSSVGIDASPYGIEKYGEGYSEGYQGGYGEGYQGGYGEGYQGGYRNGEDDQKARLTSATFVENGEHYLENGWSAVTVNVPQTGSPCNLQHKEFEVDADTSTVRPDSGYDGLSDVYVDATAYGEGKYRDGYAIGETDGYNNGYSFGYDVGYQDRGNLLSSTALTQNGTYTNQSGWSSVTVNMPITAETVTMTAQTQTFTPSIVYGPAYIGRSSAASWRISNLIDTGIYPTQTSTIRIKYKGRGVKSDRVVGSIDGYGGCDDNNDYRFFDAIGLTMDIGGNRRSVGGDVTTNEQLYDFTMGNFYLYDNINETYAIPVSSATINTGFTYCVDVGSIWVSEVIIEDNGVELFHGTAAENNGAAGLLDSVSGNFFGIYSGAIGNYEYVQPQPITIGATFSSVTVSASAICQDAYDSGVAAQQALLSSTAITTNGTQTSQNGWSSVTVSIPQTQVISGSVTMTRPQQTFYPPIPEAAFSSITVDATNVWDRTVIPYTTTDNSVIGYYATNPFLDANRNPIAVYSNTNVNGQGLIVLEGVLAELNTNAFYDRAKLRTITLPYTLETIGPGAFQLCSNLISCNIPDKVRTIGVSAFAQSGIRSLVFPEEMTEIGHGTAAFAGTSIAWDAFDLAQLTIGSACTNLQSGCFYFANCQDCHSSLSTIFCHAPVAPTLGVRVFNGLPQTGTLYVPAGSDYSSWAAVLPSGWTISASL